MCGRYTQAAAPENLVFRFGLEDRGIKLKPRYNIAPGQQSPVVIEKASIKALTLMYWGLVPSWAKDPTIGNRMINARAETLTEKRSFKRLLPRKRCLVLADGFYEWRKARHGKIPMRYVLKDRELFSFAGLWDIWKQPYGEELRSFTIITTDANDLLKPVHDRMPVILLKEDEDKWLDPSLKDPAKLTSLLKSYPSDRMETYDVSTIVNSPMNDRPECIQEAI